MGSVCVALVAGYDTSSAMDETQKGLQLDIGMITTLRACATARSCGDRWRSQGGVERRCQARRFQARPEVTSGEAMRGEVMSSGGEGYVRRGEATPCEAMFFVGDVCRNDATVYIFARLRPPSWHHWLQRREDSHRIPLAYLCIFFLLPARDRRLPFGIRDLSSDA